MHQYYPHLLLLLLQVMLSSEVFFFHEKSHMVLVPDAGNEKTFGFSLAYQRGNRNLVTGAPHSSLTGKVFSCPLHDLPGNKTIRCTEAAIGVDELAPYDRSYAPDVKLNLGYSVSAADNYFFTCAPLWTAVVQMFEKEYYDHTIGTCFMYNGTAHRYKGFIETHTDDIVPARILGGTGWRTLVDQDWLVIAKVASPPDLTYGPSADVLAPVESIVNPMDLSPSGIQVVSPTRERHANHLSFYRNVGFSIAAGKFFSRKTVYAISGLHNITAIGAIHFVTPRTRKQGSTNLYLLDMSRDRVAVINDLGTPGSMFGAALASAQLNGDDWDELLAGAPAWADRDQNGFEAGALHIYVGDKKFFTDNDMAGRHRVIFGHRDGARFGSAIAATDLDGDSLSEVFVSAPYEDLGLGALYILSGHEINTRLLKVHDSKQISLSDLKGTQRIQNEEFKTFGYSLHVVPDIDNNGCNELAVGSPMSGNIMVLRCLPSVKVTVTAEHIGEQLKLLDNNFTIRLCVTVNEFMNRSSVLSLTLYNEVEGTNVYIENDQTRISMDVTKTNCSDVVVKLADNEAGDYVFHTNVEMDENEILNSENFDTSWALISPYSLPMKARAEVSRRCHGADCDPKFNLEFNWFGGTISNGSYDLGSSEVLTAKLSIHNIGNASWDACAQIAVSGATVAQIGCVEDDGQYTCMIPKGLRRNQMYSIDVKLNMSQPQSSNEEVEVRAIVYDFCEKPKNIHEKVGRLKLNLYTNDIILTGLSQDQNISDTKIQDKRESKELKHVHEYWIENKSKIMWTGIVAEIVVLKKPFLISARVIDWPSKEFENKTKFSNTFDLPPGSKEKFIMSTEVVKAKILENLVDNILTVQSSILLRLRPNPNSMEKSLSSIIRFEKEQYLAQNKNLVIMLAVVAGMIVLAAVMYILYKIQFFDRPEKVKLEELQEIVRRQSMATQLAHSMSICNEDLDQLKEENE